MRFWEVYFTLGTNPQSRRSGSGHIDQQESRLTRIRPDWCQRASNDRLGNTAADASQQPRLISCINTRECAGNHWDYTGIETEIQEICVEVILLRNDYDTSSPVSMKPVMLCHCSESE